LECPVPFPPYALTNIGARIRAAAPVPGPEQIGAATIRQDIEENRVSLSFPAKLSKQNYNTVRQFGFVWSPTRRAFVRKLNNAAIAAARAVAHKLATLAEDASQRS
jgi:hypothetical protein